MSATIAVPAQSLSAREIRKLPVDQRDAILQAAAALAESEYRTNRDLTAFEAFGKGDLHGTSTSTQTR